ncbi:hypothetical protein mRhiFer1_008651 [Rhinolophus ferrumequinum]|uniref:Uncharacterized protein n=1 Tax=Rhinolophus ferrumequinum TaxID=59479 RepID=A0A7J7U152_RHIFE|nr:hypothetical protein mRhiFer1_008651 [Rhinolophus ferrumequinum]
MASVPLTTALYHLLQMTEAKGDAELETGTGIACLQVTCEAWKEEDPRLCWIPELKSTANPTSIQTPNWAQVPAITCIIRQTFTRRSSVGGEAKQTPSSEGEWSSVLSPEDPRRPSNDHQELHATAIHTGSPDSSGIGHWASTRQKTLSSRVRSEEQT